MKRLATLLVVSFAMCAASIAHGATPALSQPALSPDGSEIAFVAGGDIWTVPAKGGVARLLVASPATDSRPLYSPDGKFLAFDSDRSGNGDVYLLDLRSGALRRLTWDDGFESLDSISKDGRWIYYSSNSADVSGMDDVYRVSVDGGTPMIVSGERYTNEYFADPSPDGKTLALTALGIVSGQWWRHGHSHIDTTEIWTRRLDGDPGYTKIVAGNAKNAWPMWSPSGDRIYFMSDRDGNENLWSTTLSGDLAQLTRFTDGRVLWPTIAANGSAIAFERDFGISLLDLTTGGVAPVTVDLLGAPGSIPVEHRRFSSDIDEVSLSPDGKKVAFVVHGEVFAADAKEGGDAFRVTTTPAAESQISWAPDSKRLVYVSERGGAPGIWSYDFGSGKETRISQGSGADFAPFFSPDGKSIAYLRNGREIHIVSAGGSGDRVIATANVDIRPPLQSTRPYVWSHDGRWIAFMASGERMFRNAWVVPVDGSSTPAEASFLANVNNDTVSWSPDGTYLLFDSSQRTEPGEVARVDLVAETPKFREQQFRELFEEQTPKSVPSNKERAKTATTNSGGNGSTEKENAIAPVKIDLAGIRSRLTLLPLGIDVSSVAISPDGKHLLVDATSAGQENLYVYPLDPLSKDEPVAKQITSTTGSKRSAHFTPDSKEVIYLDRGKIMRVSIDDEKTKPIAVTAEMDVDFGRDKLEAFDQAWSWMRDLFHDPKMNGADWNLVRREFQPRVEAASTPDGFRRLLSLMVGELNASHLGARSSDRPERTTGHLGLRFDRDAYEKNGILEITEVVPLSPAAVSGKIAAGDVLLAIDGKSVDRSTPLAMLLDHRIGKETRLTVSSPGSSVRRDVAVKPVSLGSAKELLYRAWVESNRAYVDRISGGRLGYVHMADMSSDSLARLMVDLDAQNLSRDGVVIDIRNNNGGFVNAYALDVFGRRHYLNMTFRGMDTVPARSVLGQRALEKPTVLVTNRHSLSDAEDFAQGYRAMQLGKVVGEPTAGWIIYTTNQQLVDGTIFRIPFITISTAEGEPMEL
ncbi:MAG: LpqB family beta-propeller domain-containing protein, partial [Thermoanaerobaculia bacterium]